MRLCESFCDRGIAEIHLQNEQIIDKSVNVTCMCVCAQRKQRRRFRHSLQSPARTGEDAMRTIRVRARAPDDIYSTGIIRQRPRPENAYDLRAVRVAELTVLRNRPDQWHRCYDTHRLCLYMKRFADDKTANDAINSKHTLHGIMQRSPAWHMMQMLMRVCFFWTQMQSAGDLARLCIIWWG